MISQFARTGFAGGGDMLQVGEILRTQNGDHRGRQGDVGNAFLLHGFNQAGAGEQSFFFNQMQSGAVDQRIKNLIHRSVEAERGKLQHAPSRTKLVKRTERTNQVTQTAVLQHGAFGFAGRA